MINNVELYGIDIQDLARKCQLRLAASTSISKVPGKKSRELLVQGNKIDFVTKLFEGFYSCFKRMLITNLRLGHYCRGV